MRRILAGSAIGALVLVAGAPLATPAAASGGLRDLVGAEKRSFLRGIDSSSPPRCAAVSVARANPRWAIFGMTGACGPTSGHNYVYKLNKRGEWKFLFYDMESDGCDRWRMPASVRAAFSPYVC